MTELELAADLAEIICLWHNILGPRPVFDGEDDFIRRLFRPWLVGTRFEHPDEPTLISQLMESLWNFGNAPQGRIRGNEALVRLFKGKAGELYDAIRLFLLRKNDVSTTMPLNVDDLSDGSEDEVDPQAQIVRFDALIARYAALFPQRPDDPEYLAPSVWNRNIISGPTGWHIDFPPPRAPPAPRGRHSR